MTLDQFKAWFEGFAENIDYAPTRDQWNKVKAKVAELGSRYVVRDTPAIAPRPEYPPEARSAWLVSE